MKQFIQNDPILLVPLILITVAVIFTGAGSVSALLVALHPAYDNCLQVNDYVNIAIRDCVWYADANDSSTVRDYLDHLDDMKELIPESLLESKLG